MNVIMLCNSNSTVDCMRVGFVEANPFVHIGLMLIALALLDAVFHIMKKRALK